MNLTNNSPSNASLAADLRSAADRARDERLKLAAMVKQQHASVELQGGPAPASQIAALSEKIQKLDDAISARLARLDEVDQRIEDRTARLEDLQLAISKTSKAFAEQVEKAQHFKHHVDAAKQHVRMSAGQIIEDIRLHLQDFEAPIAERLAALNDLDEQMDKRIARMQQMHKQAGDAVDKHLLGALRQAKEQAASMVEPIKEELDAFLKERAVAMEQSVQEKIAALDVDVEEALAPVTSRFDQIIDAAKSQAAELADALPGELDARCETHIEQLRESLMGQVAALMQGTEEKALREAAQRYRQEVGNRLGSMFDEVEQEAELFSEKLTGKLDGQFEAARERAAERFAGVIDELEAGFADRAEALVDAMTPRIEEIVKQAEQDTRIVAARAGDIAANAADTALQAVEHTASQVMAEAQRVSQQLREISDSVTSAGQANRVRIAELEREAARLLSELTEMAEASGRRVSSSLATLSRMAKDKAEQAQAEIEGRTRALGRSDAA